MTAHPTIPEGGPAGSPSLNVHAQPYWPRWVSGWIVVCGLVLIVLEPIGILLFLLGLFLTGSGIYGLVHRSPPRPSAVVYRPEDEPRGSPEPVVRRSGTAR